MKNLSKKIFIAILVVLCSSCYQDMGNYEYHDINEVHISEFAPMVRYTKIDSLILTPNVSFTQNPNLDYKYEWSAIRTDEPLGEHKPPIIIGTEQTLNYKVELPEGVYLVKFKVTDPTNNLEWSKVFQLKAISSTYMGWLILCDDKGLTRLDMIEESSSTRKFINTNLLIRTPLAPPVEPLKLSIITPNGGYEYEIFLHARNISHRLVAENISWEESNDFKYIMANPSMGSVNPDCFATSTIQGTLMVADEDLYWRKYQGSALFGNPVNLIDNKRVPLAPYIGSQLGRSEILIGTNNFILFDPIGKRFLRYTCGDYTISEAEGFPKGYDLVTMINSSYDNGASYAILKREDGYYLFQFFANQLRQGGLTKMDIPNIETITKFAFDPIYPYMYYIDNNQLYLYSWTEDLPENKITHMPVLNGDEVTVLKYNPTVAGDSYPDQYLIVATVTATGKGKFVLYMPRANRGPMEEYTTYEYEGLTRIVDVAYRDR